MVEKIKESDQGITVKTEGTVKEPKNLKPKKAIAVKNAEKTLKEIRQQKCRNCELKIKFNSDT